jgi:hypothetical protein
MAEDDQSSGVNERGSSQLFFHESDEAGEVSAYRPTENSPTAKVAEDYQLFYHSEVDNEVLAAWKKNQGAPPKRKDQRERLKDIMGNEYAKRPTTEKWKEDMSKVGVGAQNVAWTDKSVQTNVPDPSNPGFKADAETGTENNSAGQGVQNDVNISQQIHKEEVVNPRLRFQGTNVVNHFSPVIRKPTKFTMVILKAAAIILKITNELAEEQNA